MTLTNGASAPGRRKVMIATPTKSGDVTLYYALAFGHTMYLAGQRGVDLYAKMIPHDNFIHNTRNRFLKMMLEDGCTDIVFIDADNDWMSEWVFALLAHPVDCVGGTYARKQDAEHYELRSLANPVHRCPKTGLLVVDGLGAGFLRLSRKAVQALWDASPPYLYQGEPQRMMCDVAVVGGNLVGEDTMLVANLARLGIPTHLDDRMTCGHVGTKRWKGDVRPWLERVQRDTAPYPPRQLPEIAGLTAAPPKGH